MLDAMAKKLRLAEDETKALMKTGADRAKKYLHLL